MKWNRVTSNPKSIPRIYEACLVAKSQSTEGPVGPRPAWHVQLAFRQPDVESNPRGSWNWSCADGEMAGPLFFDRWRYVGTIDDQEVQI